jgi:MFS transporter, UMF1 family
MGATSAILFLLLPSSSPIWFLSAFLAAMANVGFGVSVVAMNAYLPELGREAPEVQAKFKFSPRRQGSLDEENAEEPLLAQDDDEPMSDDWKHEYDAELSRTTSRISSMGIALGYGAGILLLILALIPVTMMKGTTFSLRLAIGLSGIWWALFTIPAAIWLPSSRSANEEDGKIVSIKAEVVGSWKRLGGMLHPREIKKLRNTFKYLGAWFLLSDGKKASK